MLISNPDNVKASIRRELGAVKTHFADYPDFTEALDLATVNIINSVEEEVKVVVTDSVTRQQFLYYLAGYLSCPDERRAWYYFHAIATVIAIKEVTEVVKQKLGANYDGFTRRFYAYSAIVNKIKYHFDHLEEKTLKDGDTENSSYLAAMDWLGRLPLIWQELDAVFIIICRYTNLGQLTVPNTALSIFAQTYKKVAYTSERRERENVGEGREEA